MCWCRVGVGDWDLSDTGHTFNLIFRYYLPLAEQLWRGPGRPLMV